MGVGSLTGGYSDEEREDLIKPTWHQVLAPIGLLLKNGSVFIYSGITKTGNKKDAVDPRQKQFAAKMLATWSRVV